jgi:hypothetical protein
MKLGEPPKSVAIAEGKRSRHVVEGEKRKVQLDIVRSGYLLAEF